MVSSFTTPTTEWKIKLELDADSAAWLKNLPAYMRNLPPELKIAYAKDIKEALDNGRKRAFEICAYQITESVKHHNELALANAPTALEREWAELMGGGVGKGEASKKPTIGEITRTMQGTKRISSLIVLSLLFNETLTLNNDKDAKPSDYAIRPREIINLIGQLRGNPTKAGKTSIMSGFPHCSSAGFIEIIDRDGTFPKYGLTEHGRKAAMAIVYPETEMDLHRR